MTRDPVDGNCGQVRLGNLLFNYTLSINFNKYPNLVPSLCYLNETINPTVFTTMKYSKILSSHLIRKTLVA